MLYVDTDGWMDGRVHLYLHLSLFFPPPLPLRPTTSLPSGTNISLMYPRMVYVRWKTWYSRGDGGGISGEAAADSHTSEQTWY